MRSLYSILLVSAACCGVARAEPPHATGFSQSEIASNPVTLNGAQRMRVLRFVLAPAGRLTAHQHSGPGYLCVLEGQMNSVVGATTTPVGAGQCAFDPGDANHSFTNAGASSATGLTFEIIPPAGRFGQSVVEPGMESMLPPR